MDYKLIITTSKLDESGLRDLAATILGDYGDDYDAARGDFATSVEGPSVIVLLKDVARGDTSALADRLAERYDGLVIAASHFENGHWWPVDLEGDDQ